jgi:hypothetical protein
MTKIGDVRHCDFNPERVYENDGHISLCRFCGSVHEGTISYGLQHWRECTGIVAFANARAEGVDVATALRIGARCYIHREGAKGDAGPIGPMIERMLATPSPYARNP